MKYKPYLLFSINSAPKLANVSAINLFKPPPAAAKPDKSITYLSNVRQIDLVKKAYLSINNAKNSLSNGIPIEMISTDLKECYEFLGEIIGKTYKDDIIDRLFQDFCVGK